MSEDSQILAQLFKIERTLGQQSSMLKAQTDDLSAIRTETKLTNGRVNKLERVADITEDRLMMLENKLNVPKKKVEPEDNSSIFNGIRIDRKSTTDLLFFGLLMGSIIAGIVGATNIL